MKNDPLNGQLELLLLSSLVRGPAHGYAVIEWLAQRSNGVLALAEGTVYPALHRLEEEGLVLSRWENKAGERRRRVYSLTRSGHAAIDSRRKDWIAFSRLVTKMTGGSHA